MMSINIQSLNEKELDFYNFSIKHYNLFLVKTLKEISKIYGCGMSFIYNYFSKINVTGLKNYLYELFSMKNSETALYKELSQLKIQQKFVDSLLTDFEQQTAQFKTLDQQEAKLQKIKTLLYEAEIIYGLAFGHSKLAIKDFLGFYNFINNNVNFLDYDRNSDILHSIPEKSLVIIYSIRFVNKKYSKIITDLKKLKVSS